MPLIFILFYFAVRTYAKLLKTMSFCSQHCGLQKCPTVFPYYVYHICKYGPAKSKIIFLYKNFEILTLQFYIATTKTYNKKTMGKCIYNKKIGKMYNFIVFGTKLHSGLSTVCHKLLLRNKEKKH